MSRLVSIACGDDNNFDNNFHVVVQTGATKLSMACRIETADGIARVVAVPDLMMRLGLDPRLIVKAIIAFSEAGTH